jgi:hypothetical protein
VTDVKGGLLEVYGEDGLLGLLDPVRLSGSSNEQLSKAAKELQRVRNKIDAELIAVLGEIDRREAFVKDGASSLAQWSVAHLSLSSLQARKLSTRAHRLSQLPALNRELAHGNLSVDQIDPLLSIARPQTDEALARKAQGWSVAQCSRYARHTKLLRAAQGHGSPPKTEKERFFSMRQLSDGGWSLSGHLEEESGAMVCNALSQLAQHTGPDPHTGVYDSWGERMAEALVDLVSAGSQAVDPALPSIVVHIEGSVLDKSKIGIAQLEGAKDGTGLLSREAAERLSCDALWQVLTEDDQGTPVNLGRRRRSAPHWLRSLLMCRDGCCRFPGCQAVRFLHAHHMEHWSQGGGTDPENMVLICSRHHKFLHEGHWHIEGKPSEQLFFVSPEGERLQSSPVPRPEEVELEGDTGPPE